MFFSREMAIYYYSKIRMPFDSFQGFFYMQYIYIYICTILLEQIKGFYHGITKIFLLVGQLYHAQLASFKDAYIVVHVRIDCGIQITLPLSNTLKLYTQTVQGLADYAQKFIHYTSMAGPDPSLTLQRTVGRCQTSSYNYAPNCSHALIVRVSVRILLILGIEIQNMNGCVGHNKLV